MSIPTEYVVITAIGATLFSLGGLGLILSLVSVFVTQLSFYTKTFLIVSSIMFIIGLVLLIVGMVIGKQHVEKVANNYQPPNFQQPNFQPPKI